MYLSLNLVGLLKMFVIFAVIIFYFSGIMLNPLDLQCSFVLYYFLDFKWINSFRSNCNNKCGLTEIFGAQIGSTSPSSGFIEACTRSESL